MFALLVKTLTAWVECIGGIEARKDIDFASDLAKSCLVGTGQQSFCPEKPRVSDSNTPDAKRDTAILGRKDDSFVACHKSHSLEPLFVNIDFDEHVVGNQGTVLLEGINGPAKGGGRFAVD